MKEDVTRLNTAVIGDKDAGASGLCHRVEKVEDKTKTMQDQLKCFRTVCSTVGAIWGILITIIAVFKHKIL